LFSSIRSSSNRVSRLLLGGDEEDFLAIPGDVLNIGLGLLYRLQGFLQVDDVNAVSCAVNVFLHLGVPTGGLVTEMDPCLQQLFHGDFRHLKLLDLFGFTSAGIDSKREPCGHPRLDPPACGIKFTWVNTSDGSD
jgi:hypothetical protein